METMRDGAGGAHRPGEGLPAARASLAGALLAVSALAPSVAGAQTAEEAIAACTEAARLVEEEEDIDGALDEAEWCVESLRQVRQRRTLTVFPDVVDGFAGGELDDRSAMGMTMMERAYERGEDRIDVSLTTGAAGSGLAALAQMGMSLGGGDGRKLRVQKRTVIDLSAAEGQARYLVQLRSGGVLTIGSPTSDPEAVLAFVRAFPIVELDEALDR